MFLVGMFSSKLYIVVILCNLVDFGIKFGILELEI